MKQLPSRFACSLHRLRSMFSPGEMVLLVWLLLLPALHWTSLGTRSLVSAFPSSPCKDCKARFSCQDLRRGIKVGEGAATVKQRCWGTSRCGTVIFLKPCWSEKWAAPTLGFKHRAVAFNTQVATWTHSESFYLFLYLYHYFFQWASLPIFSGCCEISLNSRLCGLTCYLVQQAADQATT